MTDSLTMQLPTTQALLSAALDRKAMQDLGFYVRMTEWHDGFQVCAFLKTDVRVGFVSQWYGTELDATQACLAAVHKIVEKRKMEEETTKDKESK